MELLRCRPAGRKMKFESPQYLFDDTTIINQSYSIKQAEFSSGVFTRGLDGIAVQCGSPTGD
jgi:hypothetical protein